MRAFLRIVEKRRNERYKTYLSICLHIHIFATSIENTSTANDRRIKYTKYGDFCSHVVNAAIFHFPGVWFSVQVCCLCVLAKTWFDCRQRPLARPDFRFECGVFIFLKRRCNQLFIQYSSILAYWKDCKDHRQVYLASQFKFGGRELGRNTLERGGHIPWRAQLPVTQLVSCFCGLPFNKGGLRNWVWVIITN